MTGRILGFLFWFLLSIVLLLLAACAPAPTATPVPTAIAALTSTPLPTATQLPTSTPSPTNTSLSTKTSTHALTATVTRTSTLTRTDTPMATATRTKTPTPTMTSEPMTTIGDQQIPTRLVDSAIAPFVKAMQMAGINLSFDQVKAGLVMRQVNGANGKAFRIIVTSNTQDQLADGTPLLIEDNGGTTWRIPLLKDLAEPNGLMVGTTIEQWTSQYLRQFDLGFLLNQWNYQYASRDNHYRINTLAKSARISHFIMGFSLFPEQMPKDLGNLTRPQRIDAIRNRSTSIANEFGNTIDYLVVVNEAHGTSNANTALSFDEIAAAFEATKETGTTAKLVYSETDNYSPGGAFTQQPMNHVRDLKAKGLVDAVATQMHILQYENQVSRLPSSEQIATTLREYGLPIIVTEMDINLTWIPGSKEQKYYKQGEIAYETIKGILASKVVAAVNFWGVDDKDSWLVNEPARYAETGGSENADPLPFHNGSPKPFFYAVQKALLENLLHAD